MDGYYNVTPSCVSSSLARQKAYKFTVPATWEHVGIMTLLSHTFQYLPHILDSLHQHLYSGMEAIVTARMPGDEGSYDSALELRKDSCTGEVLE